MTDENEIKQYVEELKKRANEFGIAREKLVPKRLPCVQGLNLCPHCGRPLDDL